MQRHNEPGNAVALAQSQIYYERLRYLLEAHGACPRQESRIKLLQFGALTALFGLITLGLIKLAFTLFKEETAFAIVIAGGWRFTLLCLCVSAVN